MRGRKPDVLTIVSPDISELERIAHSDALPWYQVRRARIVLGIAAGQRREDIASQLECDDSTIWQRFLLNLSCERKTICNMLFGNWLWQQTRSSYCTLSMLLVL